MLDQPAHKVAAVHPGILSIQEITQNAELIGLIDEVTRECQTSYAAGRYLVRKHLGSTPHACDGHHRRYTAGMWLFTRYGFLSIVLADPASGTGSALNVPELMVRGRVRQHLRNLQARFPAIAKLPIIETPTADYRYRLIVPKSVWAAISQALAAEIDYSNFKGECEITAGVDAAYVEMLHDIWELHYDLQRRSIATEKAAG